MRILLSSYCFAPSLGGIERCSIDLAKGFLEAGHEVRVITETERKSSIDDNGLEVIRCPSALTLIRLVSWCDVIFHNNISLQFAWPLLFIRRPWVVTTQTWIAGNWDEPSMAEKLKFWALQSADNIAISRAVATHIGATCSVIPNPYDDRVFRLYDGVKRDLDIVFVGRLVSDKGCDLLLQALASVRQPSVKLTIIGEGPEEMNLRAQAELLGIASQVRFTGRMEGEALARELNRHQVMVVPSRWAEPFGIVAIEGLACGCLLIGSDGGGLPDAFGRCGLTFTTGDASDLATRLELLIADEPTRKRLFESMPDHLRRHKLQRVVADYLDVFTQSVGLSDEL